MGLLVVDAVEPAESIDSDTMVKLFLWELTDVVRVAGDRGLAVNYVTRPKDVREEATDRVDAEPQVHLMRELEQIIGSVYRAGMAGGGEFEIEEGAIRAIKCVRRRYALLSIGDTITTPMARIVVRRNDDGFAEAVVEGRKQ